MKEGTLTMFDPASTLLHKCLLSIIPSPRLHGLNFLDSVLLSISEHIRNDTGIHIPSDRLRNNFTAETRDHQHRMLVNYISSADSPYPIYWAARIKSSDPTARYRIYTQHIGLKQISEYEISIHIASTSTDRLGGRFSTFHPPLKRVSPLVTRLFSNANIQCVTGNHILLNKSIRLTNQSIEYFLNLLHEKTRTLPVVLITRPDIVDPDILQSQLLGNAIVCSISDPSGFMLLNDYLPDSMKVASGSIRIYVPSEVPAGAPIFHPIIPLSDIYRMTPGEVINMLYRAYCENLRQQELRTFITTDTCADIRNRQYIANLKNQLSTALDDLKVSNAAYEQLQTEHEKCIRENVSKELPPGDDVYETMLNEYSSELELIKDGLQYMMAQVYGNSPVIEIPDGAHTLVIDLIKSINFRQMRHKSKSRK